VEYPKKEGKYGYIYQIASGITVAPDEYGTWMLIIRPGPGQKKKRAFGKSEDDRRRAIKAAELVAVRMGLTLEQQKDSGRTFGMMALEWYELNAGRWRPGTQERYACIVRDHLRPLEKMPLEKVDKAQVKRLLADLLQIRAPKTVEVTHAVISGIFTEANELGYTEVNPAHGLLKRILPSKKKRVRSEPDPFNRQDLEAFLLAAWPKLPGPYPLILETMAMTGLRLGEALALSGDNLDSRNCQYNVTETTRAGRFGPPKSGKRVIDLDETLVGKLEVHIKKMRKEGMAEGKLPGRYLFPGITQRMIQRAMQRACKAAQGRVRNPHDLRHTYATMLLMDHYSPAYVQKQLGHSSISITVDIYGHWIPGEGKMDLTRTLRGPKAKPGNPFTLVQGRNEFGQG
jgi:integrase